MQNGNRSRWLGSWIAFLVVVLSVSSGPVVAADATEAPDVLVKKVVSDVMDTAKKDSDIQSGNISKINALVESKILPYVDFNKMTASAVGRNWASASPEQQGQITEQFKRLLTYTYSGALSQIRDQTIQYKPFRADPADTLVQVNTEVVNTRGGEPVQLNYKLQKEADGWKIIDVNVLGVWLVQNYRNTFAQQVTSGGIDGLIKALKDKNDSLAASGPQKGKA
ncbi:MAG: ABC transporter substrate-binding protein [Burkholderiaceae bacterium]|jgi:phospholipid transport system substrate-binding protein